MKAVLFTRGEAGPIGRRWSRYAVTAVLAALAAVTWATLAGAQTDAASESAGQAESVAAPGASADSASSQAEAADAGEPMAAEAELTPAEPEASEEAAAESPAYFTQAHADVLWYVVAATLVMFMQSGFAMLEVGTTRSGNAVNVLTKNLTDFCFGITMYWVIGYSLMYGDSIGGFIGFSSDFLFMNSADTSEAGALASAQWFYQVVFAATAATIVSGAMAERTRLVGYATYAILVATLLYPVTGHWIWADGGWLVELGMRDFAGSTVVHSVGAWAAVAGCLMVGPRLGKVNPDGTQNKLPGHNLPLAAIGMFILWFGWYGFNAGSTLEAAPSMAYIALTTTLAAAAGGVTNLILTQSMNGQTDLGSGINGVLGGLVGITACCASIPPWAAFIVGVVSGLLVVFGGRLLDRYIDDPVGAIAVHGICGAWGTIAVGIFGLQSLDGGLISNGLVMGGAAGGAGVAQLGVQLLGVAVVFVYTLLVSLLVFAVIANSVGLRVPDEIQAMGLDEHEHGVLAYPEFAEAELMEPAMDEDEALHNGDEEPEEVLASSRA